MYYILIIKHHYIYPADKPPSIYLTPPKRLLGKGCLNLSVIELIIKIIRDL